MLAHRQGTTLNASGLARALEVSAQSVTRYIDLLSALLLRRLPSLHANVGKRLVKAPKVYVRDSGLVHALLGIVSLEQLAGHPVVGESWEGHVIETLLCVLPPLARPYFYRTSASAEIDLVIEHNDGARWAIEIKRSLSAKVGRGFHLARADILGATLRSHICASVDIGSAPCVLQPSKTRGIPMKRNVEVNGLKMAYVEHGDGDPIVFQHGNPTSGYLWRNVIPHAERHGRCIALDLIGMGGSDKLPDPGPHSYTLREHSTFFDAALAALGVTDNVILVVHDWGSALGFDWARRHPDAVAGLCYMEAIVRPLTWDEWPAASRGVFQGFRSPAGEKMVLEKNIFVERVLPGSVLRGLSDEEMTAYRRPFLNPGEDRRPTLTWPRQIPIDGEPADVVETVAAYADWLASSPVPKLFVNAEPGAILTGAQREFCRRWPNQTEVTVQGSHFIQEDSPKEIGEALAAWLTTLDR